MALERLNAYRVMWLFCFFDLPTETAKDRKNYTVFRKKLLKDGFTMLQYSVYTRHCASKESADVHIKRIENFVPPKGQVSILNVTDKQYSQMVNFWGMDTVPSKPPPQQLEMF